MIKSMEVASVARKSNLLHFLYSAPPITSSPLTVPESQVSAHFRWPCSPLTPACWGAESCPLPKVPYGGCFIAEERRGNVCPRGIIKKWFPTISFSTLWIFHLQNRSSLWSHRGFLKPQTPPEKIMSSVKKRPLLRFSTSRSKLFAFPPTSL